MISPLIFQCFQNLQHAATRRTGGRRHSAATTGLLSYAVREQHGCIIFFFTRNVIVWESPGGRGDNEKTSTFLLLFLRVQYLGDAVAPGRIFIF